MQFTRDRFTWLAYLMLAYFAYVMAALGPLMPFLRAELNLNYTVAALHLTAFALGMTVAGSLTDRLAERFGRVRLFWGGGFGMVIGALLFISVPNEIITIFSSFLMGLLGSFLLIMIQAMLSDRHGVMRAVAFSESNVTASVATAFVPLVIGFSEGSGFGWRIAMWIGIASWLILTFVYRSQPLPVATKRKQTNVGQSKRPLPLIFWMYWLVIFFSVSVEWCIGFWGADFLENGVGLERVTASTLMFVFLAAMALGRLIGSRITRTMETSRLLIIAAVIVLFGFPLFWLGQIPAINIIGLFITGFGIANLYPLTLSVATGIDPERSNTASARSSLGAGLAILIMPQILGGLADQIGISGAFGIAAVLVVIVVALTLFAHSRSPILQPAKS